MTELPAATLRTTWLIGKFQLVDALCAGRDDPAVGAARLLGQPVNDIGRQQNLYLRLGQLLALPERHQQSDRIRPLAQQIGCLAHDFRSIKGRDLALGAKALLGRLKSAVLCRHGRRCRSPRRSPG
jgi:hypothetical protein